MSYVRLQYSFTSQICEMEVVGGALLVVLHSTHISFRTQHQATHYTGRCDRLEVWFTGLLVFFRKGPHACGDGEYDMVLSW